MSMDATRKVLDGYLAALLDGGDFSRFFADDVEWTMSETGEVVTGRDAVRDYIIAVHTHAFTARPEVRNLVVGDGVAILEAYFVGTHTGEFGGIAPTGATLRVPYCVAYDVAGGRITALRGYLPIRAMVAALTDAAAKV